LRKLDSKMMKMLNIGSTQSRWKRWIPGQLMQLGLNEWIQENWERWNLKSLNLRKLESWTMDEPLEVKKD
jgi:hypothetical protein